MAPATADVRVGVRVGTWLRANAVGLALAVVACAWRAAVRARSLVTFDAGLHANGIRSYDVPAGQPHPPGYPVSVFLGRIVDVVTQDPAQAMVWLSVLWTGLAVFLLWRLGERFGPAGSGVAAAVLFVLSPLALYNGSVGLTYAADAAMGCAVAFAAWRATQHPSPVRLGLVGAAFALAVGVRPSAFLFLVPLAAWPALQAVALRERARRVGWCAAAALPGALLWLVPMVLGGGGAEAILRANRLQSDTVVFRDPVWHTGWAGLRDNLRHLADYAGAELAVLPWLMGAALLAWAFAGRRGTSGLRASGGRAAFLLAWMLPALLFHTFVYVGWPVYPSGYLMVVLPPVALGVGSLLVGLVRSVRLVRHRRIAVAGCLALLVIPLSAAPDAWREATRPIRAADAWDASWAGFEDAFPAASTGIVMTESWQHVKLEHPKHVAWVRARYDHPDGQTYTRGIVSHGGTDDPRWFDLLAMDPDDAPVHAIPPWVERMALHEGHPYTGPETLVKPEVVLHETMLPSGRLVRWFEPSPQWRAIESYFPDVDPAWAESRLAAQEGGMA